MEETLAYNKSIKLERCDDVSTSANSASESLFELEDTSLKENVIYKIEKEDPDLFDPSECMSTAANLENSKSNGEPILDICQKEDGDNYNVVKCVPNDRETQIYPIKLEKQIYDDVDMIEPFKNTRKENKNMEKRMGSNVFKQYFILLCPFCGVEIKDLKIWKEHMNSVHDFEDNLTHRYTFLNKSRKKCNECEVVLKATLNQPYILQEHTISHLPYNRIFKCKICNQQYVCEVGIHSHIEREHVEVMNSILLAHGPRAGQSKDIVNDALTNVQSNEFQEIADKLEYQKTKKRGKYENIDALKLHVTRLCPVCGKEFEKLVNWKVHIHIEHKLTESLEQCYTFVDKIGLQCNECKLVQNNRDNSDLLRHKITHLTHKNIFKCKICSKLRSSLSSLIQHIAKGHHDVVSSKLLPINKNAKNTFCVYCEKNIGYQEKLVAHVQKEHREFCKTKILLICPDCGKKFCREKLYRLHINSVHKFNTFDGLSFEEISTIVNDEPLRQHNEIKYRCKKCYLLFPDSNICILRAHAITHLPHHNYKCRYCDYTDSSKLKLLMHSCKNLLNAFKNVSGNKEQISKNRCQPLNHPMVVKTDKLYVCPSCGEEFSTIILHEQHLKMEHGFGNVTALNLSTTKVDGHDGYAKLKYTCNVCNKGFKKPNINNFKSHAFTHMPFKMYKCSLCHTSSTKLIACPCNDIDTLKGIKYTCPQCNVKHFDTEEEWFAHIRECQPDFLTPNGLNFLKIEADDPEKQDYKCNICGKISKRFKLNGMLLHALEHMFKNCFKCKMCRRCFNCKGDALYDVYNCNRKKVPRLNEKIYDENWLTYSKFAKCQCPVCGFLDENNDEVDVVGHLKQAHNLDLQSAQHLNFITDDHQMNYKCIECSLLLINCSIIQLQEHKLAHLPCRMWHCGFCELKFDTKEEVLTHIINWHLNQKNKGQINSMYLLNFACPICNKKFGLKSKWRAHLNSKHAFNTLAGFRMVQEENSLKCIDCSCNITTKKRFMHRLRHLPYSSYECRFCGCRYKEHSLARGHATACLVEKKGMETLESLISNTERNNIIKTSKTDKQKRTCSKDIYIAYACPKCNVLISTEEQWYKHITEQHNMFSNNFNIKQVQGVKQLGVCLECNKQILGGKTARKKHKLEHLPFRSFICKICRHRSKDKLTLIKHLTRKHFAADEFICVICSQTCKTHFDFSSHMKTQHIDISSWPTNLCPICVQNLPDGISVDLHFKTSHLLEDIEEYNKEREGQIPITTSDAQNGLVIKSNAKATSIIAVSTEMITPDAIHDDFKVTAPQTITTMATCSKNSTSLNKYYAYMTYACPECNISLPTQKDWHSHITTKHDFFAEHSLNIKDVSGEPRKSICLECGSKVSGSILHKQRHKLTHMPYRSFICIICLHRSKNQNGLLNHMKSKHFTPGEFKCEMCSLVFQTTGERYTHAKTQHKDEQWPNKVCRICVMTLSRNGMDEHMKTHDLDREQFTCKYCEKRYLSKWERNRHLRNQHPVECEKEKLEQETERKLTKKLKNRKNSRKNCIKIESDEDEEFVENR